MADGTLSGIKSAFGENPKARKFLIITGVIVLAVVVIGGVALSRSTTPPTVPSTVTLAPAPGGKPGDVIDRSNTSPAHQALLKQNDADRATAAESKPGAMVLPKLPGLTDPTTKPKVDEVTNRNPLAMSVPPQYVQQVNGPGQQGGQVAVAAANDANLRQSEQYKNAQKILGGVMERSLGSATTSLAIVTPPAATGPSNAVTAVPVANTAAATAALAAQQKPLIRAGEAFFGTLDTAINTDYAGPIIATIRQGPFNGARLTGTKELNYDAVVIRFTMMSPKNGDRAFPISAYAITSDDAKKFGTTGIPGETDYHIFQRYVIPGAMGFLQAFGYASSIPEQTVTNGTFGSTVTQAPLSSSQKLWVAAGGAMGPLTKDMDRLAARPITITVPANTEIGILFATDATGGPAPVVPGVAVPATGPQPGVAGYPTAAQLAAADGTGNPAAPSLIVNGSFPIVPPNPSTVTVPAPNALLPSPFPQTYNNSATNPMNRNNNPYGQVANPYAPRP